MEVITKRIDDDWADLHVKAFAIIGERDRHIIFQVSVVLSNGIMQGQALTLMFFSFPLSSFSFWSASAYSLIGIM